MVSIREIVKCEKKIYNKIAAASNNRSDNTFDLPGAIMKPYGIGADVCTPGTQEILITENGRGYPMRARDAGREERTVAELAIAFMRDLPGAKPFIKNNHT